LLVFLIKKYYITILQFFLNNLILAKAISIELLAEKGNTQTMLIPLKNDH